MAPQFLLRPRTRWLFVALLILLVSGVRPDGDSSAHAATIDLTGPAGAELFLDGEPIGFLPLPHPLDLRGGRYLLRCELPGHQPYTRKLRITDPEAVLRIHIRLMELRRRTALGADLIFAGLGQHYSGQHLRGWLYNAAEAGGILLALTGELQRSNYRKDYLLYKEEYDGQINADLIEYYKTQAATAYSDMEDMAKLRDTGLILAGSAVVLSLLDTLLLFPSVEMGAGSVSALPPAADGVPLAAARSFHVGYRARF